MADWKPFHYVPFFSRGRAVKSKRDSGWDRLVFARRRDKHSPIERAMRRLRLTIGHLMFAVAGSAVVFACFGVSVPVAMVFAAFFASALISRPANSQGWLILLIGAIAALPAFGLAYLYMFALRAALFLGHWPSYGRPDPKDLPERFYQQSGFLQIVIPVVVSIAVTNFLAYLVMPPTRPSPQTFEAVGLAFAVWAFCFILLIVDPVGVMEWYVD